MSGQARLAISDRILPWRRVLGRSCTSRIESAASASSCVEGPISVLSTESSEMTATAADDDGPKGEAEGEGLPSWEPDDAAETEALLRCRLAGRCLGLAVGF